MTDESEKHIIKRRGVFQSTNPTFLRATFGPCSKARASRMRNMSAKTKQLSVTNLRLSLSRLSLTSESLLNNLGNLYDTVKELMNDSYV
jgi:hypothetical protein